MFTPKDAVHIKNLQRLLNKAKIELEGQEILAAADVLLWVGQLSNRIAESIQHQEMQSKIAQGTTKQSGPEPSSAPESLQNKPKRKRQE